MKKLLLEILDELSPCSVAEIIDYFNSDLFYIKGNICKEDITVQKIRYELEKLVKKIPQVVKFQCQDGYKVRYGITKFKYYLLSEPRYLRVAGYIKRCMFCGMPMYIEDQKVIHFKHHCPQYQPQNFFQLIKLENFWAIISKAYIHGVMNDLNSAQLRLPDRNESSNALTTSELWLINQKARENHLIERDQILPIKGDEYIA